MHDSDASDSRCFLRYLCPVCGAPECHDEECRETLEASVRDVRAHRPGPAPAPADEADCAKRLINDPGASTEEMKRMIIDRLSTGGFRVPRGLAECLAASDGDAGYRERLRSVLKELARTGT